MISHLIRSSAAKAATRRFISISTRTNAAASLGHHPVTATPATTRTKAITYTILGSTAVIAGVSHLLKDEVVYWTPNVRQ
ncbi:hypothetical protein BGX28_009327 [Mortierella sp. GBA30]|nr:hypothetical protein BGX28_009327 [Mortierella sp. GBA30]